MISSYSPSRFSKVDCGIYSQARLNSNQHCVSDASCIESGNLALSPSHLLIFYLFTPSRLQIFLIYPTKSKTWRPGSGICNMCLTGMIFVFYGRCWEHAENYRFRHKFLHVIPCGLRRSRKKPDRPSPADCG